jgi:molecular chaperone GrpE
MSDKGPKVELPEDLAAELEEAATEPTQPSAAEAAVEPSAEPSAERPPDLERALSEARDRHLRLAAEFDNFKRRSLRERQELFNYANENLIKELLPTVDNLERALTHARLAEGEEATRALREGVELTFRSLLAALENAGVTRVDAEGRDFDPQVHEAVQRVATDSVPPGRIVEVLQPGYTLKGRLLRPALVAVSTKPAGGSE